MKKKYVIIPMALFALGSAFVYVQAEEVMDNNIQEEIILEEKEIIEIKDGELSDDTINWEVSKEEDILTITINNEEITKDIVVTNSKVIINLENNAIFTGSIKSTDSEVNIVLDETSTISLTDDSNVNSITDPNEDLENIELNDNTLLVDDEVVEEVTEEIEDTSDENKEEIIEETNTEVTATSSKETKKSKNTKTKKITNTTEEQSSTTTTKNKVKKASSNEKTTTEETTNTKKQRSNKKMKETSTETETDTDTDSTKKVKKERKTKEESDTLEEDNTTDKENTVKEKKQKTTEEENKNLLERIWNSIKSFFKKIWN